MVGVGEEEIKGGRDKGRKGGRVKQKCLFVLYFIRLFVPL